jgi:hypothetical protein
MGDQQEHYTTIVNDSFDAMMPILTAEAQDDA